MEDNICHSIWDKREVLWRTLWGTCQELGNSLTCPHHPLGKKKGKKKGGPRIMQRLGYVSEHHKD
jgi:hypothetical protein